MPDIVTPMLRLGFKIQEAGVCRGYEMMANQAILVGDKTTFIERVKDICENPQTLEKLLALLASEKNNRPENLILQNHLALMNGIALWQRPEAQEALMQPDGYTPRQQDVVKLAKFTESIALEERGGICSIRAGGGRPLIEHGVFYIPDFVQALAFYKEIAEKLKINHPTDDKEKRYMTLSLNAPIHGISLHYDPYDNKWWLFELNAPAEGIEFAGPLAEEKIAEHLITKQHFINQDPSKCSLSIETFVTRDHILMAIKSHSYSAFEYLVRFPEFKKYDEYMEYAIKCNNRFAVENLIKHVKLTSEHLMLAINHHRVDIINYFINNAPKLSDELFFQQKALIKYYTLADKDEDSKNIFISIIKAFALNANVTINNLDEAKEYCQNLLISRMRNNIQDNPANTGYTLADAIEADDPILIENLIAAGFKPDDRGLDPLERAALNYKYKALEKLVELGIYQDSKIFDVIMSTIRNNDTNLYRDSHIYQKDYLPKFINFLITHKIDYPILVLEDLIAHRNWDLVAQMLLHMPKSVFDANRSILMEDLQKNREHLTTSIISHLKTKTEPEMDRFLMVDSLIKGQNGLGVVLSTPLSAFKFMFTFTKHNGQKVTSEIDKIIKESGYKSDYVSQNNDNQLKI